MAAPSIMGSCTMHVCMCLAGTKVVAEAVFLSPQVQDGADTLDNAKVMTSWPHQAISQFTKILNCSVW
jgi:hypothetical protein